MVNEVLDVIITTESMPQINGVVIHNDGGSMTALDYQTWLQGHDLTRGFAHFYNDRFTQLQVQYYDQVAWHTGSYEGNYFYIGYEVCQSMSASDEDFLANEDATLLQAALLLRELGLPINHETVRLHHEFSSTDCPHRSMALHGQGGAYGGDGTYNTKQYFIDRMNELLNGTATTVTVAHSGVMTEIVKTTDKKLHIRITHDNSVSMIPGTEFSVYAVNDATNSCVGCDVTWVEGDIYNVIVPFDKFNDGEYKLYVEIHDDNGVPREIAWYPVQNYEVNYGKGRLVIKDHRAYLVRNDDVDQVPLTKVGTMEVNGEVYQIMK